MNLFDGKRPNHALVNEYLPGQGIMVWYSYFISSI